MNALYRHVCQWSVLKRSLSGSQRNRDNELVNVDWVLYKGVTMAKRVTLLWQLFHWSPVVEYKTKRQVRRDKWRWGRGIHMALTQMHVIKVVFNWKKKKLTWTIDSHPEHCCMLYKLYLWAKQYFQIITTDLWFHKDPLVILLKYR